ncbi:hypothetical protein GE061_017857 [Apolygus lucorum]|uniref:Uncharacterized protein n=1 Tax=Apolygus lucorum TaxID=248454 RepID=A0A8S9XE93_APOLU|nr:hypothetical protein GE061_017857 [Apolygus lucorum]
MCEHIHYLCSRTVDSPCDSIDESSCEPCHDLEDKDSIASTCSKEVGPPVQVVSNPSIKNLEDYKKKIAAIWENVKEELMTASSIEQLQTAENLMDPIIPTLRALKEEVEVKLEPSANTSSDKKRKTEPLSHFTPKKKKEESNETTTKPSGEQHNIAFRVLLPSSGANLIWTL